jgi:hypothetical protein
MSDTMTTEVTAPAAIGVVQAAFAAYYEGEPAVYVVQGGMARPIIKIDPAEMNATAQEVTTGALLAPNGFQIVYYLTHAATGKVNLWLADLSNNTSRVLLKAQDGERFSDFSWAPSSIHIAYVRTTLVDDQHEAVSELWTVAAEGGEPRRVTGEKVHQLLGWSADSSLLYYTRKVESAFTYSIFNLANSENRDVILPDDYLDQENLNILNLELGTGPDRALLAYVLHSSPYLQSAKEAAVLIVNPDTGAIIKQFKTEGAVARFSFAPDLAWVVYDTLDFPAGTDGIEPIGRSLEARNLTDDSVRTLIPTAADESKYEVLSWFTNPHGVFVADEDTKIEFITLDGQRYTIAEGVLFAASGTDTIESIGGAGAQATTIAGAVVNLALPFVHQVKMTADDFDGNWACGPSSCTMIAAYYGKLPPRDEVYMGNKSPYGWYISHEFASPANGFVFNRRDKDPQGRPFPGAYGHCVENGDGYGWRMADYLTKLGLKARCLTKGESYNDTFIKKYLDAGKPVVLSTMVEGFGHLIVIKGYLPDGRYIAADPYYSKVGVGETIYTRAKLGNTPYMVVVDDDPPGSTPPAQPQAAPAPAEPPKPAVTVGGAANDSQSRRVQEAYNRNGGEAALGKPKGNTYSFNNRLIQEFTGGSRGDALIMLDERNDKADSQPLPTLQPAFVVAGAFLQNWRANYGGSGGMLGSPVSDEYINPEGNRQQNFEGGYITMQGTTDNSQGAMQWPETFNGWKAEYYNNAGLAGRPSLVRDETPNSTGGIGYDWGMNQPGDGKLGLLPDRISARWTRTIDFGNGGNYELRVTADDGFRVYVDDQNLSQLASGNPNQFWQITAPLTQPFQVTIGEGTHKITLEYFEGERNACVNLDINKL